MVVLVIAVTMSRTGPEADEERVVVTVSPGPELSCEVDPDVVSSGTRHIDVRTESPSTLTSTSGDDVVTVVLVHEDGETVFRAKLSTATGDAFQRALQRPTQSMAKLTPGRYTAQCRTGRSHGEQQLRVVNR